MAEVLIVRQTVNLKYVAGVYLVDVFCLGLKDTFVTATPNYADISALRRGFSHKLEEIPYEDARSVILGAVEYARQLGFEPHEDWTLSRPMVEADRPFNAKFTFGHSGKPLYVQGSNDPPDFMAKLWSLIEKKDAHFLSFNPGPGGYGVVLIHGSQRKELAAGFRLTTNNRMEILGCIAGLQTLREPCDVTIYSDSRYVVNTMTKSWALRWRKHGWKRKDRNGEWKDALNADLWAQVLDLCDRHLVTFNWVRGHSGNEGNECCDQLARAAAASGRLAIDFAYENPPQKQDSGFATRYDREGRTPPLAWHPDPTRRNIGKL
jgi:ribonuclease HI